MVADESTTERRGVVQWNEHPSIRGLRLTALLHTSTEQHPWMLKDFGMNESHYRVESPIHPVELHA